MNIILDLLMMILKLYQTIVVVGIIVSWLLTFNVINGSNQLVRAIYDVTSGLTEPALRRIRRLVNPVNGLDLSPLVLLLGIWLAQRILLEFYRI